MNIYFEGLGYRNPIADAEQIMWYFKQVAKTKPKGHDTRYWLDLREWYAKRLLEGEAYELLDFIVKRATDAKEKKRIAARKKAKETSEREMEEFMKTYKANKVIRDLTKTISNN